MALDVLKQDLAYAIRGFRRDRSLVVIASLILALGIGTNYLDVFQIAGATSFMGYWLALPQNSIWWKRNWGWTLRSGIDGLIYAGLTGGKGIDTPFRFQLAGITRTTNATWYTAGPGTAAETAT